MHTIRSGAGRSHRNNDDTGVCAGFIHSRDTGRGAKRVEMVSVLLIPSSTAAIGTNERVIPRSFINCAVGILRDSAHIEAQWDSILTRKGVIDEGN